MQISYYDGSLWYHPEASHFNNHPSPKIFKGEMGAILRASIQLSLFSHCDKITILIKVATTASFLQCQVTTSLIFISMVGSYLILLTTSNMDAHLKRMTSFGAFTGAILGFSYGLSDAPEGKSRTFLNRFSFGMFTTALGSFILAAALGLPPLLYGEVHDFYRTLL
ncbi:hypothetical protein PROFUN_03991 [Planoprotostelium fungivorum]|uniref:Uncharacterized protein n=1 Tax=Planoprotostelium fungivorum TaxID=1890364 RepID=A0A2P6NWB4_9EUKA|nr:hypothetical protein PROFUN_03991 [Planoprotostelium fungivorum]